MAINKTQQFVYFQNKAKHFDNIKKAKPIVLDKLQKSFRDTIDHGRQTKKMFIPPLQQHTMKVQNQSMINRVIKIMSSDRTQVNAQGNYSRFNKVQRKFRQTNPYQEELSRTIKISNDRYNQRIQKAKAKIGNSRQWVRHFGQTLSIKRNMSRYLSSNRSKGSLHLSNQKFIPHHYLSFIDKNSLDGRSPNTIQITKQGLLNLPDIKMKNITQIVYPKQNKLVIDKSKKSLLTHDLIHNNSIASLQLDKSIEFKGKNKSNQKDKQGYSFFKNQKKKKFVFDNREKNKSIQLPLRPQLLRKYDNPEQGNNSYKKIDLQNQEKRKTQQKLEQTQKVNQTQKQQNTKGQNAVISQNEVAHKQ